ncbi:tRNA (adenosine(37)-N6)-threonylcarbamoyltransferase complex dimerization subunit type 1 TsaB [Desulfurispira natronophila]|uniref:tRNA threonylcarbamoyladenosine biosynthesis protein TsaB n=1 Tax=Desulfurispira natronophila TaxID=682562 RepID=A0A7W8DG68_9BACT|nr:tRNA (adenosine(37)-N6)-threonylcarbamoyltransferase complex dimerization subunit type 1 TsaB [Desulfurispira natronophila]MBB5021044.1 tRNA threonylcarbamoyladenosine biosynthesis protein TsaB [Desulfurispira natronophila]
MILALDTTGEIFSICLMRSDGSYALKEVDTSRKHGTLLPLVLDQLLLTLEKNATDISQIVLVNGPGSFTGLRVGASFIKGIVVANELPVAVCSRLQAVLAPFHNFPLPVIALCDAKRSQVYCRGLGVTSLADDCVLSVTELAGQLPYEFFLCGTLPADFAPLLQKHRVYNLPWGSTALNAALLLKTNALDTRLKGEVPLHYIRKSQAEEAI